MPRSFLTSSSPVLLVLTPIALVLLWFQTFYFGMWRSFSFDGNAMPLYGVVYPFFIHYPILGQVFTLLLLLLLAVYLLRINQRFMIIQQQTYLPTLLFVVFSAVLLDLQRFTPVLFAALVFFYMLETLLRHYEIRRLSYALLKVSFFIGAVSFFYAPSLYFIIFLWMGMALLRPFMWREWVYTLIGLALPFVFFLVMGFLQETYHFRLYELREKLFYTSTNLLRDSLVGRILFWYLLIFSVVILFDLMQGVVKSKIQTRRYLQYFSLLLVSCFSLFLFVPTIGQEFILIIYLPFSILASNYYIFTRQRILKQLSVYGLLFLVILNQLSVFSF